MKIEEIQKIIKEYCNHTDSMLTHCDIYGVSSLEVKSYLLGMQAGLDLISRRIDEL